MDRERYVAYLRVSTKKQGKSGLGLEAQRASIDAYLASQPQAQLLEEFIEVESGGKTDEGRPIFHEALTLCKLTGAKLIVAKLDRLSRNAAYTLQLQSGAVDFKLCDLPDADPTTVGIMAVVVEAERRFIGKRTKEALARAKARGVKLGGYRPNGFGDNKDGHLGREAQTAKANERANDLAPILRGYQSEGLSLRAMARRLNESGIKTPRGGAWHALSVSRVLARLAVA